MEMQKSHTSRSTVDRYSLQSHHKITNHKVMNKLSTKKKIALFGAILLCILVSALVLVPVSCVNAFLQTKTDGRLVLEDAEGSLWNGSAIVSVASDKSDDLIPLFPGRFSWHLSPILLLGQIELEVENFDTLLQPLYITGNFRHVQVSPNSLIVPAKQLIGLGAPLNTVKPSGTMTLSWDALGITLLGGNAEINGTMKLAMDDMSSALSPVKPLGSYLMSFEWHGSEAVVDLKTLQGPMLLSGNGTLAHGHLQFSGLAQAEKEQEENLATLLNLLGQHRPGADKNVISLEFR